MSTLPSPGIGAPAFTPGGSTERLSTALADRYRIERQLGQGGMATVYLAQDLKHDRKVALKVLKAELSAVLGGDRFVVEIKTTAGLQHPHILPLFDSGNAEGLLYYVMPYIEGETLRSKLNRETQFSVEEAVRIARDVADALDYAHRHGVVHRDIKPENILMHDGRPVVADFGIALAVSAAAGGRMTETGLSLGTPHYMSPEQATADKDITARSDIYSLGSVLYEMLTGNPPHVGASAQQIIMKIITDEAEPVTKFRKTVPPHVAAAVARSLEKLPADRFESAKAFAEALANPGFTNATSAAQLGAVSPLRSFSSAPFVAVALFAAVATFAAAWGWLRPESPREVSRFSLQLPDSQAVTTGVNGVSLAISPDGRTIVYVGGIVTAGGGGSRLWLRGMDQLRAVPLPGTERVASPAFSPDGKRIAFVTLQAPRALKAMAIGGGPALTLTDSLVDLGGVSWGYDGYVYYDGHLEGDGVARVRETGGKPEVVTRPDPAAGETYHMRPFALPDGRGLLMTIARGAGVSTWDVGVHDLRNGKHKVLARGVAALYSPTGHLVYVTEDGSLMAAPFDLEGLQLSGDAVLLAAGVAVRGNQRVDIAVSSNGTLTYTSGSSSAGIRELVWVTRDGATTPVDPAWSGEVTGRAALSPDGRYAAVAVGRAGTRAVWVKQLDHGPATRVADAGSWPAWSPDGKSVVFGSPAGLQRVPADGSALPERIRPTGDSLLFGPGNAIPAFSADGKWIIRNYRGDIYATRTDGDTARVVIADQNNQAAAALSPNGRWIAYHSDEGGTAQIYVRPFPNVRVAKRQVSINSGFNPRWSRSGKELFYLDGNLDVWATVTSTGDVFTNGTPKVLFSAGPFAPVGTNPFDVSPDDRRFLFSRAVGGATAERPDELIVVQNFFEELKAKVPRK